MALRLGLLLIILAGIGISSGTLLLREAKERSFECAGCNVILISIDTFGAKHSSVYDPLLSTTPFMKELADRSIVFENAFTQAPWTLPSHAAMLTGQYPWDLGIWLGIDRLPETALTLPEVLQAHDYDTVAFSGGAFVQKRHGFGQGFDEFYGEINLYNWDDIPQLFVDAENWITKRTSTDPFFLFLRPFGLHDPYGVPGGEDTIDIHEIVDANLAEGGLKKTDAQRFEAAYRNEVTKVDTALSSFFRMLEEQGLAENTIVIITSDHGEEFGEHGTAGFHSVALYRESIHVPLMIVLPKKHQERLSQSVEVRSVPSTVVDLLSLKVPTEFTAPSLVPLMAGVSTTPHLVRSATGQERDALLSTIEEQYHIALTIVYQEYTEREKAYSGLRTDSAIVGNWHALRTSTGSRELYRMDVDPEEKNNAIDTVRFLPTKEREAAEAALNALEQI